MLVNNNPATAGGENSTFDDGLMVGSPAAGHAKQGENCAAMSPPSTVSACWQRQNN